MKHFKGCPYHEDSDRTEHGCSDKHNTIYCEDNIWYFQVGCHGNAYPVRVRINHCPFCGEELPELKCRCDDIAQGLKERNLELRTGQSI